MSLLFNIVANIIKCIHLIIITFVIICTFIKKCHITIDLMYLIFIPFIIIHWIFNNDDCALTVMENYFRGANLFEKDLNTNFMYNIVYPLFKLPVLLDSNSIYVIMIILYIIKVYNVCINLNNNYYYIIK